MTDIQKQVAAWQAAHPAFVGPVTREPIPGKAQRRAAKAKLVKVAGGK